MRHFCTYFDHRYLARGLALHASLQRHSPGSVLWVLCLSEECERYLREADLPGIQAVALRELEAFDPELAASRDGRSLVEYYFTCSPCWPRMLLARESIEEITYLDSDLYFFASPELLFERIGEARVSITPHRFSAAIEPALLRFGRYNVGWVGFRREADGRNAALDWWRARCIEWCFDRVEEDRYADQKYLDRFPLLFPGTCAIDHPGANLAAWNVDRHAVAWNGRSAMVDGEPLVFFHFQGVREIHPGRFDSNLGRYRARMTATLRDHVFRPYLEELAAREREVRRVLPPPPAELRNAVHDLPLLARAAQAWRLVRAGWQGQLVRL